MVYHLKLLAILLGSPLGMRWRKKINISIEGHRGHSSEKPVKGAIALPVRERSVWPRVENQETGPEAELRSQQTENREDHV